MEKELIKNFILHNILHNDYYEHIKYIYETTENAVNEIYECFDNYNCYYSIYTIMDSIENFIAIHKDIYTIRQVIDNEDFEIKELY